MEEEIQVPEELDLEDLLIEAEQVTVNIERKNASTVEKTYWIRPPDEKEQIMAQNAARKISRDLHEQLITKGTEEHELLIEAGLEEMTIEEMRLLWLTSTLVRESYELQMRSLNDRDEFFVPRPEGKDDGVIPPTINEMDEYEIAKRNSERERLQSVEDQQKDMFNRLKKESESLNIDDLRNIVEPMIVEQKSAEEWNNQYGLQILVRCTFKDSELTEKAFKDVESAKKMLRTANGKKVLESLLLAHKALMLDPVLLKN